MENLVPYIEQKLFLKVNLEKSKVACINQVKFLGYSFYMYRGCRLRIHLKSVERLRLKRKELTSRSNGWGTARRKEALKQFITGWVHYFKLADMHKLLVKVDEWYRRRLRLVIWKQWKRLSTKHNNLLKLGVHRSKAWEYANTRKSHWHTANSWILATTITNERLREAGYVNLTDCYLNARKLN